jgi:hypothetical protein
MSYWRDYAQDILSSLRMTAKLDRAPFEAAVIAHGDVLYTHLFHEMNFSMSAGLLFGGGTAGKNYSGVWKKLLEVGRVSLPVKIRTPIATLTQRIASLHFLVSEKLARPLCYEGASALTPYRQRRAPRLADYVDMKPTSMARENGPARSCSSTLRDDRLGVRLSMGRPCVPIRLSFANKRRAPSFDGLHIASCC